MDKPTPANVENPFYKICKPNEFLATTTVNQMERTWDKAIDAALQAIGCCQTVGQCYEKVHAFKSTNQRGDPK